MLCSIPNNDSNPCNQKLHSQKNQNLFNLMNNVLSELFVMGDVHNSSATLKSARKQLNPRAHVSASSARTNHEASDNSIAEGKKDRKKMKRMRANDLSVCSGTVVTVIDTSTLGWKSEKRFRKKKVWNVGRKKRKSGEKFVVEKEKAERLRPLADLKERERDSPDEVRDSDNCEKFALFKHKVDYE